MSSSKPFALNVKLSIRPERREEFLKVIRYDQEKTLSEEAGALQFVVGEDTTSPNTFYLHEQYRSEDDYEAHTKAPYFAGEWKSFCESDPWAEGTNPIVDCYHGVHEAVTIPVRQAFCVNAEICVKPEARGEFLKVIENNQKGTTENEPLALQYHYGESTTEPNAFYFHEQFTGKDDGKEGFNAHAKTPHFATWEKFVQETDDPFVRPPVVNFYKTLK